MKALIFDGKLKLSATEACPSPAKGEALIKILLAGICNTDLEITKGYKNFKGIPGHEFVGIVEKINDDNQALLGKRVVGEINIHCGKLDCECCTNGNKRHCPNRTTLGISGHNGCFAEYITLPIENLHEVPDSISNESATLIEPLAASFEILEQINVTPDKNVLIIGDGKLGFLINHALATTGAKITHVGKHPEKLRLVENYNCRSFLYDELPFEKYDIVVEATGNISGFGFSIRHTKPRGTVVLKSTIAAGQKIDLAPVVVNEITIIGSRCGSFKPAIDYLRSGADITSVIQAIFPIEKGIEAFNEAKTKGSLKVLISFPK